MTDAPPSPWPATPAGAWPRCAVHPRRLLTWRKNGHGWRCATCLAAGRHTWQPYELHAGRAVPITPDGRARPLRNTSQPDNRTHQELPL